MLLKVLSVAFPYATVSPHAVGGAEQVLSRLDRALQSAGCRSIVVACEGSQTAGELFSFPPPERGSYSAAPGSSLAQARCAAAVQSAIDRALTVHHVDLVHLHGLDLDLYSLPEEIPVVVSLHLPFDRYRPRLWSRYKGRARFCCVSESQRRTLSAGARDCMVIENGVPLQPEPRWPKSDFALALGRICPEKNSHEAFVAGTRAGVRVLLGGEVFPYPEHRRYFAEQIAPRLRSIPRGDPQHAFLGRLQEHHKHALLARAKCLLHPTLAPETSSLVAMEALAAGTPVIAYRSGALPDIIDDGVTGFLVENAAEMAEMLHCVAMLSPQACREAARRRFSAERMIRQYFGLYQTVARRERAEAICA